MSNPQATPMNSTEARLINCFQLVFPALSGNDIVKATPASVSAWDSVATVTLISVVEEEFGTQIDFDNVEDILSFEGFLKHLHVPGL